LAGKTALQTVQDPQLLPEKCCVSKVAPSLLAEEFKGLGNTKDHTQLEKMMLVSLNKVIRASSIDLNDRVGLIVSTTKGNIDALDPRNGFPANRAYLANLGKALQQHFGFQTEPIVVSNACVSGILAVIVAKRYIEQGIFDHVYITSGDLVTPFILSGFYSFQALSVEACRPYCATRKGINIGEVAASALVTKDKRYLSPEAVAILGGASRNDANHISGPSRTGEGLYRSVEAALKESHMEASDIDYISAHGTATPYNDEMEAIAFDRLGMNDVPMNSLKGYFGHTLGASGLLETLMGMQAMHRNTLVPSMGFQQLGVSRPIDVIKRMEKRPLRVFLKTASGFGGCNAAGIFEKVGAGI
ncbi:MAG: beta-ketoacyl synthase, partial [Flavobacteriaceae bacterium]